MHDGTAPTIERGLDGTTTWYHDMAVEGDAVERLLTELFTEHWAKLTVGPLIEGAAYEIQFASPPKVTSSPASAAWRAPPSSGRRADTARPPRGGSGSGTDAASR